MSLWCARPIPLFPTPSPCSDTSGMLVGPGNHCIRWILSQFRRMARKSPLESGRQRPKSVRNKIPLAQFLRARTLSIVRRVTGLYSVWIGGGLSRRRGRGCGVRTEEPIHSRQGHCRCGLLVVEPSGAQHNVWSWEVAAACANTSACRQHDAQTAAYLPLGHSLGRRALAHASVEVMNWRSALRTNPFPSLLNQFARMPIRIGCRINHRFLINGH